MQIYLRPLFGVAGSTQGSLTSRLDVLDPNKEILQEGDGTRDRLKANLRRLDLNVLLVARQLNAGRDTALEDYLGTELFIQKGWSQVMGSVQHYAFLGFRQAGLPAVPTEAKKTSLPTYEGNWIPSPFSGQTTVPADGWPSYLEEVPQNMLDAFKPLDCEADDVALIQGQSSTSSENKGNFVTPLELLTRFRTKLYREFKELESLDDKDSTECTDSEGTDMAYSFAEQARQARQAVLTYSAAQQAQYGIPAFGSEYQRRRRRQQLRQQLTTASTLIYEETLLSRTYQNVVRTRNLMANGAEGIDILLNHFQEVCVRIVNLVYTNRYNHGLSKILIPLNATDNSKSHEISLMPDSHWNMWAPRVFGFPGVEHQLVEYTNRDLVSYCYSFDRPILDHPGDLPLVNDDTDSNGHVILFGALGSFDKSPHNAQDVEKQKFRAVESLECTPVDRDPEAPTVRVIRKRQEIVSFELLVPSTPNSVVASGRDAAIRQGSAPAVVDGAHEVNLDSCDRVVSVAEQLTNAARAATQGEAGVPEVRISLADMLFYLKDHPLQQRKIRAPTAPDIFGPFLLGLPSAPVRARIHFDTTGQGSWESFIPLPESGQLGAEAWGDVDALETMFGWQLGECLDLALQLDGIEVLGSDNRIVRLRELLTRSYLPIRLDDVGLSQFDGGDAIADGTFQENSNSTES